MSESRKYDFLIVGAGLYGAVFARQVTDAGYSCLVIDKRNHIAGNVFTEQKDGIHLHVYGPHIFHTNNKRIWDYVNRFTAFNEYRHKVLVSYDNQLLSFPINLHTFQQLFNIETQEQAEAYLDREKEVTSENNLEAWIIGQVGRDLYEKFIKGYTTKQWGRDPKDLPASIIKRIPIRTEFNEYYFDDLYQGIPENGYTEMVKNMLQGIEVQLDSDYLKNREEFDNCAKQVVFTGPIDAFYNYEFGALDYRGLKFETQRMETEFVQQTAVINYTKEEVAYTRIVEHKHFTPELETKHSYITKEYPTEWKKGDEAFYPVNDDKNKKIYEKYRNKALQGKVIFGGRLGQYKYYDMHQVIGASLAKSDEVIQSMQ